MGVRLHSVNSAAFDNLTPENAYWLGFLVADGCITKANSKCREYLSVNLGWNDKPHLEKLKNFLEFTGPIYETNSTYDTAVRLVVTDQTIVERLKSYGVTKGRLNAALNLIPNNCKCAFIRGLFDGDGCFTFGPNHNKIILLFNTEQFATEVRDYLTDALNLSKVAVTARNKRDRCFAVSWARVIDMLKFYRYFYAESGNYLLRKKVKFEQFSVARGLAL